MSEPTNKISAGTEQHVCPQCTQGVPNEDTATYYPTSNTRQVRVHCDHCGITAISDWRLTAGSWSRVGQISQVTGRKLTLAPIRKTA